ncbi:hypothetical protein FEA48_21105 [Pseudomonas nitroreducens]|uniref:Uncharacterized protein n=1 Tax=Pseudomonas nitroreducens TaxID=46680 RepID=A0A5R8ZZQ8_PSENT|nr:hypothetical protein [Pseudomonas nitroreducens]TLP71325.1 hypothetical protein FEA48_21105 [Pseudomonas nitroreducens]
MDPVLGGLLCALIGAYLTAHYKSVEHKRIEVAKLTKFLRDTASALADMREMLRNGKVPTSAGNRLKTTISGFHDVLQSAPLSSNERARLIGLLFDIEQCLVAGQAEDDYLEGKILHRPESDLADALREMDRVSARIEGMAIVLEAS